MSKENNDSGWRPSPHYWCERNFCAGTGRPRVTRLLRGMPRCNDLPDPLCSAYQGQSAAGRYLRGGAGRGGLAGCSVPVCSAAVWRSFFLRRRATSACSSSSPLWYGAAQTVQAWCYGKPSSLSSNPYEHKKQPKRLRIKLRLPRVLLPTCMETARIREVECEAPCPPVLTPMRNPTMLFMDQVNIQVNQNSIHKQGENQIRIGHLQHFLIVYCQLLVSGSSPQWTSSPPDTWRGSLIPVTSAWPQCPLARSAAQRHGQPPLEGFPSICQPCSWNKGSAHPTSAHFLSHLPLPTSLLLQMKSPLPVSSVGVSQETSSKSRCVLSCYLLICRHFLILDLIFSI